MLDVWLERDCSIVALDFDFLDDSVDEAALLDFEFLDDLLDGAANATSLSITDVVEVDSLGGKRLLLDIFREAGSSLISLSGLGL